MECRNLRKRDVSEPILPFTNVKSRCLTLASKFTDILKEPTGYIFCDTATVNDETTISLGSRAGEVIERNAGQSHRVVQLCSLSIDVFAWVGFRERWRRDGKERSLRFVDAGFTLHVGRQGDLIKPQILRSEWVGMRGRHFHDHIGHPHWQIDIMDTARRRWMEEVLVFGDSPQRRPNGTFGVDHKPELVDQLLLMVPVEKMHLASFAPWWQKGTVTVANAPANVSELDRWIVGCISYLRQEVERCEF